MRLIMEQTCFQLLLYNCLCHCYRSPYRLTRQIVGEYGVQGLFRGLTSTWVREMPGYFMFFGGYEYTKSLLTDPKRSQDDLGN